MEDNRFTLVFQMLTQAKQEQRALEEQSTRSQNGPIHADTQPSDVDEIAALRQVVHDTTLPQVCFYTTTGA